MRALAVQRLAFLGGLTSLWVITHFCFIGSIDVEGVKPSCFWVVLGDI